MPLTQSFTLSPTSDPSALNVVDTSTGTDGAVVGRKINIYDVPNVLFGASPYDFPNFPASASITINPFTADKAINVVITWINNVGAVLYTASKIYTSTGYAEQFYYQLTQQQQGDPSFLQDQQYFQNKSKLRVLIVSANQAITEGNDIFSANTAIALYQVMLQNPKLYF
jgi:hypothetical protein